MTQSQWSPAIELLQLPTPVDGLACLRSEVVPSAARSFLLLDSLLCCRVSLTLGHWKRHSFEEDLSE